MSTPDQLPSASTMTLQCRTSSFAPRTPSSRTSTSASARVATECRGCLVQQSRDRAEEAQSGLDLVHGDITSASARPFADVKLHLPVAHLEAGLRSLNRRTPEEHDRAVTVQAANPMLTPTNAALKHSADENVAHRLSIVGHVMADAENNWAALLFPRAPSRE